MKRRFFPMFAMFVTTLAASTLALPALSQNHAEHYVLDGFGGVHAGGGAPVISPATPYFGFDVAADLEFVAVGTAAATGNGLLVLDKFGGVHRGGALVAHPPGGATPYFGFNVARALALRDVPPRASSSFNAGALTTGLSSYVTLATAAIRAPDDGFLLVTANANVDCTGPGSATIAFSVALGVGNPPAGLEMLQGIPDCSALDSRIASVTYRFPVAAGSHSVRAVGRKPGGNAPTISFSIRSIAVLFVDRDLNGAS
jgi:hypothetical protein